MIFDINIELLQTEFDKGEVNCSRLNSSVQDVQNDFICEDSVVDGFVLINKRFPMFIFSNTVTFYLTNVLHFENATVKLHAINRFNIGDFYDNDIKLFLDEVAEEFILVAIRDEDSYERLLYHLEDYYLDTIENMKMTHKYKNSPDDISGSLSVTDPELDSFLNDALSSVNEDGEEDYGEDEEDNNLNTSTGKNLFII